VYVSMYVLGYTRSVQSCITATYVSKFTISQVIQDIAYSYCRHDLVITSTHITSTKLVYVEPR